MAGPATFRRLVALAALLVSVANGASRARTRGAALITAAREKRCSRRARPRDTAARSPAPSRAAFYLPGVAPKDFTAGERVELKVNKLTSTRTHLPYDYYSQVRSRARRVRAPLPVCVG